MVDADSVGAVDYYARTAVQRVMLPATDLSRSYSMTDLHAEGRRAELELTSLRVQRDIVEARIDALTKYTQSLQRAIKKQTPKEAT
jgi:hypothetical protein